MADQAKAKIDFNKILEAMLTFIIVNLIFPFLWVPDQSPALATSLS
jgi:hypothetical protein